MERGPRVRRTTAAEHRTQAIYAVSLVVTGALGGLVGWLIPDGIGFLEGFAVTVMAFTGITVLAAAVTRDGPS